LRKKETRFGSFGEWFGKWGTWIESSPRGQFLCGERCSRETGYRDKGERDADARGNPALSHARAMQTAMDRANDAGPSRWWGCVLQSYAQLER
jgi:hypothetical protein